MVTKKLVVSASMLLLMATGCNTTAPETKQSTQTPPPAETQTPPPPPSPQTTNWKPYGDLKGGWTLKTPNTWVVGGSFDAGNDPKLTVSISYISRMPTVCELGMCQPTINQLKKDIEKGSIAGVVSFQGGKGVITTGTTLEGGTQISPWYKLGLINGDEYLEIQLTDYSTSFASEREVMAYLNKLTPPAKASTGKYQPYNDFITMIEKTLIIK